MTLKAFIDHEKVPSIIDITNEAIDVHLSKRLIELCYSEKKLVVGKAEYKRIIETNLTITCLHVDVPDCEMILIQYWPFQNLLSGGVADPAENLSLFLGQHKIYFSEEMVNYSIIGAANQLYKAELCEHEYLKFLRLLLKDFMIISGIDTKDWAAIKFATALKMICYPGASYRAYRPLQIFSVPDHLKIKAHASGCAEVFSKVDVLSVYSNVIRLTLEKYSLWRQLVWLAMKYEDAAAIRLLEAESCTINAHSGQQVNPESSIDPGQQGVSIDPGQQGVSIDPGKQGVSIDETPEMTLGSKGFPLTLGSKGLAMKYGEPAAIRLLEAENSTITAHSGRQVNPESSIDPGQQGVSIDETPEMRAFEAASQAHLDELQQMAAPSSMRLGKAFQETVDIHATICQVDSGRHAKESSDSSNRLLSGRLSVLLAEERLLEERETSSISSGSSWVLPAENDAFQPQTAGQSSLGITKTPENAGQSLGRRKWKQRLPFSRFRAHFSRMKMVAN